MRHGRSRFSALVLISGLVVASCGGSSESHSDTTSDTVSDTVSDTGSDAESAVTETTTTNPGSSSSTLTTVVEVIPALATDPRVTVQSSSTESCRIADPTGPVAASSGFPRPEGLAAPERIRILAVPVSTADHRFGESDRVAMEDSLTSTAEYFSWVSYGKGEIEWSTLDTDEWVEFDATSEELGLVGGGPTEGRSGFVGEVYTALADAVDLSSYDVVAVYLPAVDAMVFGESGIIPGDPKSDSGVTQRFLLLGGGYVRFWPVTAHELGHAWIGFEDLYSFENQSLFLGAWDIMQLALLVTGPELTAWNRWLAGWLDDSQVRCVSGSGTTGHFVAPVEGPSSQPRVVVVPTGVNSAVVIETRRISEYDQAGDKVVVYSVDTGVQSGFGPIRLVAELDVAGATVESGNVRVEVLERSTEGDLVGVTVT